MILLVVKTMFIVASLIVGFFIALAASAEALDDLMTYRGSDDVDAASSLVLNIIIAIITWLGIPLFGAVLVLILIGYGLVLFSKPLFWIIKAFWLTGKELVWGMREASLQKREKSPEDI